MKDIRTGLLLASSIALLPYFSVMAADGTAAPEKPAASVNLNDTQVTPTERRIDEKQTAEANKFAAEQAKVLNKVPGVKVSPEELKEKPKKKGFSINPIRWIMGPVIQLQEQTVRLQQQMMKLTGPIAALQPAMLNLQSRVEKMGVQMQDVQSELKNVKEQMGRITPQIEQTVTHMKGVDENMGNVSRQMSTVQSSLSGTYKELKQMRPDLTSVRADIGKIRGPITKLQEPIASLKEPLISMAEPIHNLDSEVQGVHRDIRSIRSPLTKIERPITSLDKQIGGLYGEITQLRNLLAMVLTSIFVAAGLIAVGTPLAAIMVWRNREKLLPKPKANEHSEEELVGSAKGAGPARSSRR